MPGRILAVGDIHGCNRAFTLLLSTVQVTANDVLVVLGDAIDRGPESKEVVEQLLSIQRSCKLIFIMGNHEQMMRDALMGHGLFGAWQDAGGRETLASYGGHTEDIPPAHIRFLTSGIGYWESESDIFVHASLEPKVTLKNQNSEWLRWKHLGGSERPYLSGKRVVCGHTPQDDGYPWVLDGWVCIDTCPHQGKYLTCLDVATNMVYQASQSGSTRSFPLSRVAPPE